MTSREEIWTKALFYSLDKMQEAGMSDPNFPERSADEILAAFDKRFGKRPTSEYTVDDLPPFDLLEDGVGISGVMFYRHYDQANQNFCLKTQKDDVIGGPYYSNTNNERDFKRWWETMAGAVVRQAIMDMDEE
jgi:hypothetical protein